ncbi:L,D-transpeptidase-like protein [Halospina denitrificans]|uniref:L,D-transpeptidase-like protein n=1 Tax=Halospina denitrificans TaxID=332522 RepID=A0A4R7JMN9_9GAMM|nr:L,D-transpeptidase [Halospina denitrificans]TDT39322.1 L,D-transpeptidase-like protein [Halospina denitrificans]
MAPNSSLALQINLSDQVMTVFRDGREWLCYRVSTALAGPSERDGSGGTPRGRHRVRACIGGGQPRGAVFRGRRPTGETWSPQLSERYPDRDWILTRILWLCGEVPGYNRLGNVDSMRRFIYIHGTPDTEPLGVPASHGCIRMGNDDILQLWEWVTPGTPVNILERL